MGLKDIVKKWLDIKPADPQNITIDAELNHEDACFEARLWYRGSGSELDQFYKSINGNHDGVIRSRFWAAVPSSGNGIRKIHTGLAGLMADTVTSIVVADLNGIEVTEPVEMDSTWQAIAKENDFDNLLGQAITDVLVEGDGAWKISFDSSISELPIIEFYPASRVKFEKKRGRVTTIVFNTRYYVEEDRKAYYLEERYSKNRIDYKLVDENAKEVPLSKVPELADLTPIEWEGDFQMALPMMFYKSPKYAGRGRSIFDRKIDAFDAFDESVSQWQDALRLGRVTKYIPETMVPRNPDTGKAIAPNAFDNQYIAIGSTMGEGAKETITTVAPSINFDGLLMTYTNTLDMCLQGILSPSTLGVDVKKLDNAEAQREKEKVTLYTRNKIIDVLNDILPKLVEYVIASYQTMNKQAVEKLEAVVTFGEYANPSFEAQVETLGKASTANIMSVETQVEELWGDTKDDDWKAEEVKRIKAEKGIIEGGEEPPPEVM